MGGDRAATLKGRTTTPIPPKANLVAGFIPASGGDMWARTSLAPTELSCVEEQI